jgi:decaprenyl-phosphate phosphoribosyltransferase
VAGRRVLNRYTPGGLRLLLAGSGAGALFAYCVWAFQLHGVDGVPWRLLTVVPFAACLLRYGTLVRGGEGEAPEEMLLSDRVLLIGGALWLLLFSLSVHAAG